MFAVGSRVARSRKDLTASDFREFPMGYFLVGSGASTAAIMVSITRAATNGASFRFRRGVNMGASSFAKFSYLANFEEFCRAIRPSTRSSRCLLSHHYIGYPAKHRLILLPCLGNKHILNVGVCPQNRFDVDQPRTFPYKTTSLSRIKTSIQIFLKHISNCDIGNVNPRFGFGDFAGQIPIDHAPMHNHFDPMLPSTNGMRVRCSFLKRMARSRTLIDESGICSI